MSLYRRTLLIIGAIFIGSLAVAYALSQTVLMDGFARVEENRATLNVERSLSVLSDRLAFLDATAIDWAAWDDTYTFIQDGNKGYIDTNLGETTFTHLELNLMLFINSADQIVFGKAFDLQSDRELPLPLGLQEHLYANAPLLRHSTTDSSVTGIVLLPDGPMLVASRPILTSEDKGPIQGSLIMGRYLDTAEIERLAQIVKLPVTISQVNDPQMPADFQKAGLSLSEKMPTVVATLNADTIAGYSLVNDIYGKPAVILKVDMPRDIYAQGQTTVGHFLILFLVAGLASGVIALVFLDRLILSRLAHLSHGARTIGKSGDLSARVPVTGKDELSGLANNINEMLARLEQAQSTVKETQQKYKLLVENANEAIVVTQEGRVKFANPRAIELTGYSIDELTSRPFAELIYPDDRETVIKRYLTVLRGEELVPPYHTYRIIGKGGDIRWAETTATRVIWEDKPASLTFLTDITERKQAEEALRGSEEKYRLLVENTSEAIIVLQDGTVKFANPRATELSGYTSDELSSKPFIEFIRADDRNVAIERYLAVLSDKELSPLYHTYRIVTKGGNIILAETTATKVSWAGKPASLVFMTDVTERMRMEDTLKQSEERYRTILEDIEDNYFEVDLAGNLTFVNDSTCRSLGYTNEEMIGLSYKAFTADVHVEAVYQSFNKVYRTGKPVRNFSWEVVRKDGAKGFVEASVFPLRDENGEITGFRGVGHDVTVRKQAEEALRQSEEKYRTVLEDMDEGYLEIDLAGNFSFFNDAMCQILGHPREELMGMNYRAFAAKGDIESIFNVTNKVFKTGKPARDFCYRVAHKDGSMGLVESSIYPRRNDDGEVIGFRAISRDVTDQKMMEQQMLMTSKLASIGELAAGVAHELNNPLTGVIGYAQLLVDNDDVSPEIKSDLKKIHQESQRAAKIVQNLLSFARQRKPEKDLIDINELIQKTLDMRSYRLRTSNIKVHLDLSPDVPLIMADSHQIQQVLLNILVNAEQALTKVKRQGKLWVTSSAVGGYVRISITDNGPGIPKENISRIFDPFFTTKEVGQGTGLGLSVCHGIITAHNGNISVESEKGKGTTFTIKLPIIAEESRMVEKKAALKESRSRRRKANGRILIVDDEPSVRESLTRILSERGYQTDGAPDAKTALTKIAENNYDLCIIDLKMPKTDGTELYKIMKRRYPASAERVVFITGDMITPATQGFLDSTGRPYLAKPFTFGEIVRVVEEVLRGGRR